MKNSAAITVPSHPRYLSVVRAVAVLVGELSGLDRKTLEGVKLAVDEACSNVIKYAYGGKTEKRIIVRFAAKKDRFEVTIEDSGIKADPGCLKGRSLDEIRPGGLGLHLIRRAFDIVEFDRARKRGNKLRLVKYIERGAP